MDIFVSYAEEKDIDAIYDIEKECFGDDCWTLKMFQYAYCDKFSRIIKAVADGEICGFLVYVVLGGDEINIDSVAVSKKSRKCGVADKMMKHIFETAKETNIKKITLEVREGNIPAIKLYEKYGFTVKGLRKNYYENPVENAVLMDSEI